MRTVRRVLPSLLLALALAPALPAGAQSPDDPGDGLRVVLLTMGNGDAVWEMFGHNAIWIHDPAEGTDRVYNYGVFDFDSPGYWSRFIAGNWLYELGVGDIASTLAAYRWLNRSVWAQELALTEAQKRTLQAFLDRNALPENREYLYDYYRDNCSTRVRDALDLVLGGRLRAATEGRASGTTFRWHSERLGAVDPLSYVGLAAGLGPRADREIDLWEEMFLPAKVRERVREIAAPDPNGAPVPLVSREWTLFEAVGRAPERAAPPARVHWFLLAGVLYAGALAGLARAGAGSAAARAGHAALASLWLLASGVGGAVLLFLWGFTSHTIAHANENLLQLSPLALPLLLVLPFAAYGARGARRAARDLAVAVAALSLLGAVLQLLPGLDQRNAHIVAFALPVNLALAWSAWTSARRPAPGAPLPQAALAPRRGGGRLGAPLA
jgi:hypothetical protein